MERKPNKGTWKVTTKSWAAEYKATEAAALSPHELGPGSGTQY